MTPRDRRPPRCRRLQGGGLIEVLVTLFIMATGLMGLAGYMVRQQGNEIEAYQRAQALLLLNDMAQRLQANRAAADDYETGTDDPLGAGMTCPTLGSGPTRAETDLRQWCDALQGASTTVGTGADARRVGAMVGARGCVEVLGPRQYLVTVAWQGPLPLTAPAVACGAGLYNGAEGSQCSGDRCRRVVTTLVRIGNLAP